MGEFGVALCRETLRQPGSFGGTADGIDETDERDARCDEERSIVPTLSESVIRGEAMMVSALKF